MVLKITTRDFVRAFFGVVIGSLFLTHRVFAHPGHDFLTFYAGFIHPFSGLDHLLAALAVGVWASGTSHKSDAFSILKTPLSFLGGILAGAFIGQVGIVLPFCEEGILLSLVLLGFGLILSIRSESSLGALVVFLFGAFHGNAHGLEVSHRTLDGTATFGFLLSTGILHAVGIVGVSSMKRVFAEKRIILLLRFMGIGLVGSAFIL